MTRVAELIDPVTNCWDEDLVRQTFNHDDAQVILGIPLCEQHDDFIAWHFDQRGLFSVKSAYKVHTNMLRQVSRSGLAERSSGDDWRQGVWRSIWKTNCPGKVQHFIWRFAHNSHPLYMNIARRGVELETRCAVCGRDFEDGGHLFFRCKEVKIMWRAAELEDVRCRLTEFRSPLELLECIFRLPEVTKLRSICLLWTWWTERNKTRHRERRASVDEFIYQLNSQVADWTEFFGPKPKQQAEIRHVWKPPPENWVLINTDATFNEHGADGGWGCIARGTDGVVFFAAAGRLLAVTNALHAEAIAMFKAIKLAEQFGMGRVIFATDCLNLKQALCSDIADHAALGILFREAKFILQTSFFEFKVVHCNRKCNVPAHLLANLGTSASMEGQVWLTNLPPNVNAAVVDDVNVATL